MARGVGAGHGRPGARVLVLGAIGLVAALVIGAVLFGVLRGGSPSPDDTGLPSPSASPSTSSGASPGPSATGTPPTPPTVQGRTWAVAAAGDPGDGSDARPLVSLQAGLDAAQPGDLVVLRPGSYVAPVSTVRSGAPGRPITVWAQPGAVLRGQAVDTTRLFTITHSWVVIEGLELSTGDKGFWLERARHVTLRGNHIHDIGGECVRIKYFSSAVEVANNQIGPCGLANFDLAEHQKNGEGVYIGTAVDQLARNPTSQPDATTRIWVHGNTIRPRAECVDIKESATHNLVENNDCAGGIDPDGSGLNARGNSNTFRNNTVRDYVGKGVRLGGDTPDQGIDNDVYGNTVVGTGGYAIGVMRTPQGKICGNTLRDNAGPANDEDVDPAGRCD